MGCAGSKERRCSYCDAPYSPSRRALQIPVAHPLQRRGESNHSLTSTTLGSLSIRSSYRIHRLLKEDHTEYEESRLGVTNAKKWSDVDKPPITPCTTPPGDPEVIDASEIMKGLDDSSPLNFSPCRKSLPTSDLAVQLSESITQNNPNSEQITNEPKPLLAATKHEKIVLYFTSLRGVRKTFEDCCNVRGILRGHRVKIDERDVSMHSGFKDELLELLGDMYLRRRGLPRVFIGTEYIGGAEDIKKFHEEGQLEKLLGRCEKDEYFGDVKLFNDYCLACGDVRFVPCKTCSGSCKVFYEEDESSSDYEESGEFGFRRCRDCNENGLIRCPLCCD